MAEEMDVILCEVAEEVQHLNIIKLHDTLHQREIMIQRERERESRELENVSSLQYY